MLRASCPEVDELHVREICSTNPDHPGIEHGTELIALADALCAQDAEQLNAARASLENFASREYISAAVAVAANFQMMNRILDATGVPVNPRFAATGAELGFSESDWTRPPADPGPAPAASAPTSTPAISPARVRGPSNEFAVA